MKSGDNKELLSSLWEMRMTMAYYMPENYKLFYAETFDRLEEILKRLEDKDGTD